MKTVLIADDEESLRTLIETTLEAPGLRVLHAADGNQAVELARREHPDLILLDWMMPGKTGIEVAEVLRSQPATADIAILNAHRQGSGERPAAGTGARHSGLPGEAFQPAAVAGVRAGSAGQPAPGQGP